LTPSCEFAYKSQYKKIVDEL
jgi:hypothetical protein